MQIGDGRAQRRGRVSGGEPRPGADVAGVSPLGLRYQPMPTAARSDAREDLLLQVLYAEVAVTRSALCRSRHTRAQLLLFALEHGDAMRQPARQALPDCALLPSVSSAGGAGKA